MGPKGMHPQSENPKAEERLHSWTLQPVTLRQIETQLGDITQETELARLIFLSRNRLVTDAIVKGHIRQIGNVAMLCHRTGYLQILCDVTAEEVRVLLITGTEDVSPIQ